MKQNIFTNFTFIAIILLGYSSNLVAGDISSSAFNGKLKEVATYIKNGADVNAKDENGSRPIISAVNSQSYEIVKLLLSNGAKVDAKDSYGQTALFAACEAPVFEENGKTFFKIAKLLVKHGANVNTIDGDGISLIKYCIESEADKRVIKLLKSKKAH